MYFELRDGKAFWAKYKIITTDKDENSIEIYVYSEEEKEIILKDIKEYEMEDVPPPPQDILDRAREIEGKTLSKSEFEKMLYEKTTEEKLQEENESMKQSIAELSAMMAVFAPKE